jgi:hypothetical protein
MFPPEACGNDGSYSLKQVPFGAPLISLIQYHPLDE